MALIRELNYGTGQDAFDTQWGEDGLKAYPKTAGCDRAASLTGQGNHH